MHLLSPSCHVSLLMSSTIKLFVQFFLVVDIMHVLIPFNAKNDVSLSKLVGGSINESSTIFLPSEQHFLQKRIR